VRWFAYKRSDGFVYLQRDVDGVIEPESLVIPENVSWFDFIVDPVDPNNALIYWLSEGLLSCVSVTSTPIGELPATFSTFNTPNAQFTDSFEAAAGWDGIVTPSPDFNTPNAQFTDSFETTAGWAP